MSNVRITDALAQALTGGIVEARQHAIMSQGQLIELARGELGRLNAIQLGKDFKTLYLACDNCLVAIHFADDLAVAAWRAMMEGTVRLDRAAEMERSTFRLGVDGKPVSVITEPK